MRYYLGELGIMQKQEKRFRVKVWRKMVEWFLVFILGTFTGYLWMAKAYGLF